MGDSKMLYLVFLFFLCFSFSSSFDYIHRCPDEQRDALLVLKQNLSSVDQSYVENKYCKYSGAKSYNPVRMNWNMSTDCCDWDGITCDNFTGDVINLNLGCGMVQGTLQLDILLSSLPKLEVIDLSYSGLSVVTKYDAHYVYPDLYELGLASCNLTAFPNSLRAMKNLQVLDLSSNYISGHIPDWAGELGGNNLTYLDLSYNAITSLPKFKSDGLRHLYLGSNQIQGLVPPWICKVKHLKYLDVSNNNISGMAPQCLQDLSSSLVSLNLRSNMIQGAFPMTICNMSNLLYLDMSHNSFHGVIPQCFGNITSSLAMINLGKNKFHGTIPEVYGRCGLVEGLLLYGNELEGEVPRSLAKCESLKVLDLGNNMLNGTFPRWLGYFQKLQVVILRSNNLHGAIETPCAKEFLFPSLRVFDISSNGFVGPLPEKYFESFNAIKDMEPKTEFVNISSLHHPYTINNLFEGLQILFTVIDLSSNRFEGEIPNVVGNLKSLQALNLSNNNLSGQIPSVIGNILDMEALDLSRNQLVGEIPQNLINLAFLYIFNVSQNQLVGRIPKGNQFDTFFEDSYLGNPGLCGLQLTTQCENLSSPQVGDNREEWIHMKSVMLGLGFGTVLGVILGYRMLSTGRPKWYSAIADAGGYYTTPKKGKPVYMFKRN